MQKAGDKVAHRRYDGVTHEFFGMAAVVKDAKEAQQFAGQRLRESFEASAQAHTPGTRKTAAAAQR